MSLFASLIPRECTFWTGVRCTFEEPCSPKREIWDSRSQLMSGFRNLLERFYTFKPRLIEPSSQAAANSTGRVYSNHNDHERPNWSAPSDMSLDLLRLQLDTVGLSFDAAKSRPLASWKANARPSSNACSAAD